MKRKQGQTIRSDARNVIWRVIQKCDEEGHRGQMFHPLQQATLRAANYVGVSTRTITRIRKEGSVCGENESIPSPGKKRPRSDDKKFHCSLEDQTIIRNIIYDFYAVMKVVPTGHKLLEAIQDKIDFPWALTTLHRLLKRMGFTWRKTHSIRKVLIEKPNIVAWRSEYLQAVEYYRKQNRNIIYLGETRIDNTFLRCWQSEENLKIMKTTSPSHCFIIMHAGGKDGFISGAELIFKSQLTASNSQRQINAKNCERWLTEKLLPNIPPKCVIVIDNASYHSLSVRLNIPPSKYSTKERMIDWLKENNIPHGSNMRKYQLFELIEKNKKLEKIVEVDEILRQCGHNTVRLPPHMHDLNPLELAWTQAKMKLIEKNISVLSCTEVEKHIKEAINEVTPENWLSFCNHVEILEREYWEKDEIIEEAIDNLGLQSGDSDSDSDESTSSDE